MSHAISSPQPLKGNHDTASFECGAPELDDWLKRRALRNEVSGASRTFVVTVGDRVVGYYALATGAVSHEGATRRIRRNMPEPVPVMVLARLAVHRDFQGQGLGAALLKDALLRTLQASEIAGIRALLLHAASDSAKRFYLQYGFAESPIDPMTLMITLPDLLNALGESRGKG